MEFFLDTANLDEIRYWQQFGVVDGVTTNPALLAKEGVEPVERIRQIAQLVKGPISVEVTKLEHEEMFRQAINLSWLAPNVIIKLPARLQGFLTAQALKNKAIQVNVTLVFHPSQAIPFIRLRSEYISLFIGRVEDFGLDNTPMISQARRMRDQMGSSSKILAASIRNPKYLIDAILGGVDAITVPPSTWEKVYNNPMFKMGETEFMQSWSSLPDVIRQDYEKERLA